MTLEQFCAAAGIATGVVITISMTLFHGPLVGWADYRLMVAGPTLMLFGFVLLAIATGRSGDGDG